MGFWDNLIGHLKTILLYRWTFAAMGKDAVLINPLKVDNPKSISIGQKSYIAHYSWLMGNPDSDRITLKIGNKVQIGHFAHIIGMWNVTIEDEVLLADKVYISDCGHSYEDVDLPVVAQSIMNMGPVTIGTGAWLGENVCVCGANVGKHSIIGANSVVTKDIPDYCVAVGAPASVVKKYNFQSKQWEKVK